MKARLSLSLPTWSSDLTRRRLRLDGAAAIVLSHVSHQRELVAACCPLAARAGVHLGMTIAHARALIGGRPLHLAPLEPEADARTLHRLAAWMLRFVPLVAVDGAVDVASGDAGLLLDASGCEQLYRGIDRLIARILRAMHRLGLRARIGAAPTWGAAWALARYGLPPTPPTPTTRTTRTASSTIISDSPASTAELRAALAPLPVQALRLDPLAIDELQQVGIEHIGQLYDLSRSDLADRYDPLLLLRLDQALGEAIETITPIRPPEPVLVERLFDGPTSRLEDIQQAIQEAIAHVAGLLLKSESGSRWLEVTLLRSDLQPLVLDVRTARPTRDPRHLWALLRPKTETAQLGFGVEGICVHARSPARLVHEQQAAWAEHDAEHCAGADDESLARLLDTLAARLGPTSVQRLAPRASHRPERALAHEAVSSLETRPASTQAAALIDADRPSLLYPFPLAVSVVFLQPEGPLARVRIGSNRADDDITHTIITCIGPERIEPEWWRPENVGAAHLAPRDYFKVQTDAGCWLWIYRELQGAGAHAREPPRERWFLHGLWA